MKWISTIEKLPAIQDKYLVVCYNTYINGRHEITTANLFFTLEGNSKWAPDDDFIAGHDHQLESITVTHWMPLPDLPKKS